VGSGSTFGEQTLVERDARRSASAVAVGAVETLTVHRDTFAELLSRSTGIERPVRAVRAE